MFCDVAGQVVVERPVAGQGELLGDLSDLAHLCVCVCGDNLCITLSV